MTHPARGLQTARRGERGFTLIELLVSLTLLAVILGLLGGGIRVLSRGAERNADRIQTLDMLSRAFDILKRDAAGLQRLAVMRARKPSYLFTGSPTHLSFVTIEPPYPTAEGPYFVDYSVSGKAELIRARAPFELGMMAFPGATPANRVSLVMGQVEFRFRYGRRTPNGLVWQDSWTFPTRLPHLIRLDIIDTRTRLLVLPPLTVPIRADAEINCLEQDVIICSANPNGELMVSFDVNPNIYRLSP
jgi:general secretion pathway protein J